MTLDTRARYTVEMSEASGSHGDEYVEVCLLVCLVDIDGLFREAYCFLHQDALCGDEQFVSGERGAWPWTRHWPVWRDAARAEQRPIKLLGSLMGIALTGHFLHYYRWAAVS